MPLAVGGEDLSNVIIVTSKGATRHRQGGVRRGRSRRNTAPIRVSAVADRIRQRLPMPRRRPASLTAEGTFEMKGLPGPRLFRVDGLPPAGC